MKHHKNVVTSYLTKALAVVFLLGAVAVVSHSQKSADDVAVSSRCWALETEAEPESSLVADGRNVYFAGKGGNIASVDAASGNRVWNADLGGRSVSNIIVQERDLIAVTAAVDETGKPTRSVLRSLSKSTGIANWSVPVTTSERYFLGSTAAGIVAVAAEGSVALFDPKDGDTVWKRPLAGAVTGNAHVDDRNVIVSLMPASVVVMSTIDGSIVSTFPLPLSADTLTSAGGKQVVTGDARGNLMSHSVSDGSREWKFKAGAKWTFVQNTSSGIAAVSADNFVYMISPERGAITWKRRLPGRITGFPALSEDFAIAAAYGESIAYVINLHDGRIVNQITLPENGSFVESPILVTGETVAAITNAGLTMWSFSSCGANKKAALNAPPR